MVSEKDDKTGIPSPVEPLLSRLGTAETLSSETPRERLQA